GDWTGLVLAEPALERLVQNMSDPADQSVSASQKKRKQTCLTGLAQL
ncbi:hypothetical protein ISN44_As09g025420, partial [Arabidopsis suecica]